VISSIVLKGQRLGLKLRTEGSNRPSETTVLSISSGERARNPGVLYAAPALKERRQRHLAAVLVLSDGADAP
jgi:hypothetical protein